MKQKELLETKINTKEAKDSEIQYIWASISLISCFGIKITSIYIIYS